MDAQFQDLSMKHTNNIKLLRQVRAKQMRTRREVTSARAEETELNKHGEGKVYRVVGRGFVLESKDTMLKESADAQKEGSKDLEKFEKQSEFLVAKVKENEQQMAELMKGRRT